MDHGDYTLVNCSVSPGFVWGGLEMLDESSEFAVELPKTDTFAR